MKNKIINLVFSKLKSKKNFIFLDQILLSGGNFLQAILLARWMGMEDFGRFSLIWVGILFFLSLHQAAITKPIQSLAPQMTKKNLGIYFNRLFKVQLLGFLGVFLVYYLSNYFFNFNELFPQMSWLESSVFPLALWGIGYLILDYFRKSFIVLQAYKTIFILDLVVFISLFTGYFYFQSTLDIDAVLMINGFSFVSILPFAFLFMNKKIGIKFENIWLDWNLNPAVKLNFNYGKWLIATASMQWFSGNYLILIGASILGVHVAGIIKIAQNIVGLSHIIFQYLESMIPVEAARIYHSLGQIELRRFLIKMTVKNAIPVGGFLLGTAIFAPSIIALIYGDTYVDYAYVLRYYTFLYVFVYLSHPFRFELRTIQYTKPIFIAYLVCTIVNLISANFIINKFEIHGLLAGLIFNQLLTIILFYLSIKKQNNNSLKVDKRLDHKTETL